MDLDLAVDRFLGVHPDQPLVAFRDAGVFQRIEVQADAALGLPFLHLDGNLLPVAVLGRGEFPEGIEVAVGIGDADKLEPGAAPAHVVDRGLGDRFRELCQVIGDKDDPLLVDAKEPPDRLLLLLALADDQGDSGQVSLDRDAVLVHVADDVEGVDQLAREAKLLQRGPEGDHLAPEFLFRDGDRDRGGETHRVGGVAEKIDDQPDREELALAEAARARDREVALLAGRLQHPVRPRVPDEVRVSVRRVPPARGSWRSP